MAEHCFVSSQGHKGEAGCLREPPEHHLSEQPHQGKSVGWVLNFKKQLLTTGLHSQVRVASQKGGWWFCLVASVVTVAVNDCARASALPEPGCFPAV